MRCLTTMTSLYILHLSSFTFIFLESLLIVTTLRRSEFACVNGSLPCLLISGVTPSLVYSLATFIILQPKMMSMTMTMCWVDMMSPYSLTWISPVSLLTIAILITLTSSWCSTGVGSDQVTRAESMVTTRYSILVTVVSLAGVCILGPMSHTISLSHTGKFILENSIIKY